jgi:hypothetical protein
MKVIWILILFALGFMVGFELRKAYGGEKLYAGAAGNYHYHNDQWEGLWIANDFPSCCGERDCFKAGQGEVEVERLEAGNGFLVTWAGQEPEFVPYNAPNLRPSQDGEYWACYRLAGGTGTKQTRCLFTPPLGF